MVSTLVEPKKTWISQVRTRLLSAGFLEEVEYDSINIEPVLIYSNATGKSVFLKHKWDVVAMLPLKASDRPADNSELIRFVFSDEEGNDWLRFQLPADESFLLKHLELELVSD